MIDITFIHNFFWEGFPSNKDELLDFIENEKEDKNQAFAWSEECSIEVKGIKIENNTIQKFLPLLRTFFKEIEATKNIELKLKELWVNTYKRQQATLQPSGLQMGALGKPDGYMPATSYSPLNQV